MAGVNKVILVGNLGRDPEVRYSQDGKAITRISIATSETWKDRQSGERQEKTEWHRIVFFGRQAEVANEYLKKGSKVYVEGRLQTNKWQDQNGQDRYTTEIVASQMTMLDSRGGGGGGQMGGSAMPPDEFDQMPAAAAGGARGGSGARPADDFDDDIPF